MFPELTEVAQVELIFQPAKPKEAHALTCLRGSCPERLLKSWTGEFQRFFEKQREQKSAVMNFAATEAGIPQSYRVTFEGRGRNTIARLVSTSTNSHWTAVEELRCPGIENAALTGVSDWRSELLRELEKFIEVFAPDETDRMCLQFAFTRLRDLAVERPQYFTLTVFGAFIAAAHSEGLQDDDPTSDLLFQAAGVVLQRAVAQSEFEPVPTELLNSQWNVVFPTLSAMLRTWLPKRR